MEITLIRQLGPQVNVLCDGQLSHSFDLCGIFPGTHRLPSPVKDPVVYGHALYHALFLPATLAQRSLTLSPLRLLLVLTDEHLDAVPWEYVYGPHGFLVQEYHFVRGLPA